MENALTVLIRPDRLYRLSQLVCFHEAQSIGDLFDTGDLEFLALLYRVYVSGGLRPNGKP